MCCAYRPTSLPSDPDTNFTSVVENASRPTRKFYASVASSSSGGATPRDSSAKECHRNQASQPPFKTSDCLSQCRSQSCDREEDTTEDALGSLADAAQSVVAMATAAAAVAAAAGAVAFASASSGDSAFSGDNASCPKNCVVEKIDGVRDFDESPNGSESTTATLVSIPFEQGEGLKTRQQGFIPRKAIKAEHPIQGEVPLPPVLRAASPDVGSPVAQCKEDGEPCLLAVETIDMSPDASIYAFPRDTGMVSPIAISGNYSQGNRRKLPGGAFAVGRQDLGIASVSASCPPERAVHAWRPLVEQPDTRGRSLSASWTEPVRGPKRSNSPGRPSGGRWSSLVIHNRRALGKGCVGDTCTPIEPSCAQRYSIQ